MSDTNQTAPWNNPPERKKTLRRKRAEKAARKAERWGRLLEEARQEGPDREAEVAWERLRAAFINLPQEARDRAYESVVLALEHIRETHAQ
ncbi:hypothetical protein [Streptomyces sp. TRM68367]|uniref:hypothetical protein n=1 Tax=Streptomyces sp. TRM68367 TaxID=2758415 RepID=UPI00165C52A0|nr:hypothetical protein [Streptomyces sp. TRM68367]MBC9730151.1 hypothetical protein [Streptomyces sp. TRM68367]